MNGEPAGRPGAAVPSDIGQCIEDAIAAGWAWSVFSQMSSDGPLAWGIEVSEEAAVKRVEQAIRHKPTAAFGGIAGPGTEKVCQRTASGSFRWRPVSAAG
jgi:hypothetical protein